ncbi:MAG: TetR/AcrR family transcriptional regulator [Elstera sp.]
MPRKKAPSDTRQKLIDAALIVVARDGLEAASVKSIAQQAGITPGLLHYHFTSKEALLEAALTAGTEAYIARVRERQAVLGGPAQLAALFAEGEAAITAERDFLRLRLAFAAKALTDAAWAETLRQLNRRAIQENALSLAKARGEARANGRDEALAATLKAAFDGVMLTLLITPDFNVAAAREILLAGAQAYLAANAPPSET